MNRRSFNRLWMSMATVWAMSSAHSGRWPRWSCFRGRTAPCSGRTRPSWTAGAGRSLMGRTRPEAVPKRDRALCSASPRCSTAITTAHRTTFSRWLFRSRCEKFRSGRRAQRVFPGPGRTCRRGALSRPSPGAQASGSGATRLTVHTATYPRMPCSEARRSCAGGRAGRGHPAR